MQKLILIISLMISVSAWANVQQIKTKKDFENGTLRGFNIGMVAWHDANYYKELKSTGANVVRVHVPFNRCGELPPNMVLKPAPEQDRDKIIASNCIYAMPSASRNALTELIAASKQYNFWIIPVAKVEQRNFGDFWTDPILQDGLAQAWKSFAQRYKNESRIIAYDLLDNPTPVNVTTLEDVAKFWHSGASILIDSIRTVDENKPIIVTSAPAGSPISSPYWQPFKDKNVVRGINMYYPQEITLQGTSEVFKQSIPYPAGLEFNIKPTPKDSPRPIDKIELSRYLDGALKYSRAHSVPVFINEFSIQRVAPNGSAFRYISDVTKIFEENVWGWAYNGFRTVPEVDPFIASSDANNVERSVEAPVIKVLRGGFKNK